MSKKILQLLVILLIIFLLESLALGLMYIWDVLSKEVIWETFLKTSYTFGAIFATGLIIMLVTSTLEKK